MQNRPLSMALDWKSTCKIETRTYKIDVLHFRYRERLLRNVLGSEFLKLILLFALVDGLRRVFHTAIRSGYLFRDKMVKIFCPSGMRSAFVLLSSHRCSVSICLYSISTASALLLLLTRSISLGCLVKLHWSSVRDKFGTRTFFSEISSVHERFCPR